MYGDEEDGMGAGRAARGGGTGDGTCGGAGGGAGGGTGPGSRAADGSGGARGAGGGPGAGAGSGGAGVDGPWVDVVLDLAPGAAAPSSMRTASATVSVSAGGTAGGPCPIAGEVAGEVAAEEGGAGEGGAGEVAAGEGGVGEVPAPADGFREEQRWGTGRRRAVIANDSTATIPVHLLFRDDPGGPDAPGGPGVPGAHGVASLPVAVARHALPADRAGAGVRRPPVPRSPQVQPPTRRSPVADPHLVERPGPALPGWVAVLTGLAGTAAGLVVLWWAGALPVAAQIRLGVGPRPYQGIGIGLWGVLAPLVTVVLFAFGGLGRGRVGYALVLTLFGEYRGSVRRTGLLWISPLLLRRRADVRLRHWRSEPMPAVDANGTALRVTVLVVWRVTDTVRAVLGVADHETYLREQVEAAMARVLSQLPADAFHEDAPTLRNAEAVGDALTRMLKADCRPVGVEVYSAQPTGIEYAPEVAAAMQRRRVAVLDAKHRDSVLTSVVDAVDDTVNRLTVRGLVALDDYERKSLVRDLTVAFYTGRGSGEGV